MMQFFEYITMTKQYDIFYTDSVNSPLHWHYYSEILYILKGSVTLICNNTEAVLNEGDLCYIYPLQLHEIRKARHLEVNYAVLKFDIHNLHIPQAYLLKFYNCFIHRTRQNDFAIILTQNQICRERMETLIKDIVHEFTEKHEFYALQIQAHIFSLLIMFARTMPEERKCFEEQRGDNHYSFHHILEYIDTHSAEPLEIQVLADMCHMSYSYFAKLFRENYGRSCKEYITYIRLNKAQELLLHTDRDLNDIALETGFFDCSHFIRTYKKWKGITPKQERLKLSN